VAALFWVADWKRGARVRVLRNVNEIFDRLFLMAEQRCNGAPKPFRPACQETVLDGRIDGTATHYRGTLEMSVCDGHPGRIEAKNENRRSAVEILSQKVTGAECAPVFGLFVVRKRLQTFQEDLGVVTPFREIEIAKASLDLGVSDNNDPPWLQISTRWSPDGSLQHSIEDLVRDLIGPQASDGTERAHGGVDGLSKWRRRRR